MHAFTALHVGQVALGSSPPVPLGWGQIWVPLSTITSNLDILLAEVRHTEKQLDGE